MNKSSNKRNTGGNVVAWILLAVIVVGIGSLLLHTTAERKAAYDYTDVGEWIVERGDTLWVIAANYSDNRHDVREVIQIIYDLNPGLSATIHPGQRVTVPLFECMDWEEGI